MTVYNINLGIGWASSGVEYAQAYRGKVLRTLKIPAKFIFTDFFSQDNICDLTRNIGFHDEEIIWLYSYFTDMKLAPSSVTVEEIRREYPTPVIREEADGTILRLFFSEVDFITIYRKGETTDLVRCVEIVARGNLIRKDFYTYQKTFSEYYIPKDNRATLYQRSFYNEDGSIAYEEFIGENPIYRFSDRICYSKEELMAYFLQSLGLTEKDIVILDRATGIGQAVFQYHAPAKLGVVVHAEHYSANAVTDSTILWNNFYDYQFTYSDEVDFFLVATERQKETMLEQFETFEQRTPVIRTIPVGSLACLKHPTKERSPFSLVTASRLASEKHIDWLVKAVIQAHEQVPGLTFDIYGAGGEEQKLRDLISQGQAESYIQLKGHKELNDIYQEYEVYVTASTSEGFGLTLLEAIGSGLPIIGFDVPYGNQTFVKEGENGYLIPRTDTPEEEKIVASIVGKICKIFQESNLSSFHEVSYKIAENYLDQQVEKTWRELVEEMTHD
ncbi:accessory Sec system glycosyltransferase GtfA [Streptococcus himalayensis]|uniref:UDP-N-acetylglucosamine--peptide N-acetylglucosaminyltransferase GtfA subunit n=1 Tax=Streptococcus himalayensis TaxID=1888195 RepID=A0A917EEW0_9STRE|nr:accessory Sec system glycosyltransferase GtfA [Streptococcus himalayensis]GGE33721.1 glycosyltransferase Gtf1 [Streptococcus himalayensis]